MGLGSLAVRTGVIVATWFDEIRAILIGDFVGRDNAGAPVSGNNLGNQLYPWGNIFANKATIGGVNFNPSTLEQTSYQIVSGKVRSGSNQPMFLRAAGSGLTFSLFASTTNLVLTIAGVAATWIADKTGIAGVAAPSTQNTCTVNDATAVSQAATRTWGEYGTGTPYKAIPVNSMGTNISNRIGSFQAFKIGTEYFLGYVLASNSIGLSFRGYFFDSSDLPIKRSTIANGATITLMNLGFVFADQDLVTVDTIFVGAGVNNAPTWAYTSPTSPSTGDYWYDETNQLWKRYSGSAWVLVNRILVGMVVCDSANCVASRSLDFFGLCRSDSTIEADVRSNTVVRAIGPMNRINVNGKRIDFGATLPTWDTASNLAASTERYNAAVSASTTEYFYVSDQGELKISDMEPYWRPDLLGYYHPFNPWRSIGYDVVDASAHFQGTTFVNQLWLPLQSVTGAQIAPATITGDKIASDTVLRSSLAIGALGLSSSCGTFSTASTSYVDVTNLSLNHSNQGGFVRVELVPDNSGPGVKSWISVSGGLGNIALMIDGVIVSEVSACTPSLSAPNLSWLVQPGSGNHAYKIQLQSDSGANTAFIVKVKLMITELATT